MSYSFFGKCDRRKKKREPRICVGCAVLFYALKSEGSHYCSITCRDDFVGGPPEERLERLTDRSGECWLWLGGANKAGYGVMSVNGRTCLAHRVSWKLKHGSFTPGLMLCHTCNTPRCVNPAHLYEGTHEDNMRDMREANRGSGSKTSWTDRHQMVADMLSGKPITEVAAAYGVGPKTVRRWVAELHPDKRARSV